MVVRAKGVDELKFKIIDKFCCIIIIVLYICGCRSTTDKENI